MSKGNRIHRRRNDSGIFEDLEVKSYSREMTLAVRSTREAIEATSPTIAIALVISAISILT